MSKSLFLSICLLFAIGSFANVERNPQLQNIFKQAITAMNKGDYHSASDYFRKMLKNHPNLLRPRLELARALYKNGDYRSAKYHFEQVLSAANLPANVRANVNHFLSLIRQQLPNFAMSLNLSFNEKIPKRTRILAGLPFVFDDSGITRDSYNFAIDSKIPINPKMKTFAKLKLQHNEIINNDNDSTYLKASVGKHYSLSNSATITPEIGIHHLISANKKLYGGKTLSLRYFKPISRADYLTLTYNHKQLDYVDSAKNNSGKQNQFTIGYIKLPSISSRLDTSLSLLQSDAQNNSKSYDKLSFNLSYNQDVNNAWNLGFNFSKNRTDYQANNGISRKEKQKTLEITLLNRLWQINNIAPKLTIGKSKNRSNIDIYGKSQPYIRLGFTQQF